MHDFGLYHLIDRRTEDQKEADARQAELDLQDQYVQPGERNPTPHPSQPQPSADGWRRAIEEAKPVPCLVAAVGWLAYRRAKLAVDLSEWWHISPRTLAVLLGCTSDSFSAAWKDAGGPDLRTLEIEVKRRLHGYDFDPVGPSKAASARSWLRLQPCGWDPGLLDRRIRQGLAADLSDYEGPARRKERHVQRARKRVAGLGLDFSPAHDRFTAVDVEATGFKSESRIIEISLVVFEAGEEVEAMTTLVNPGAPIPQAIRKLTGIHDRMIAKSPPFRAFAQRLRARLDGQRMVAHHARFERQILEAEFARAGVPMPDMVDVCTLKLARKLSPKKAKCKLDAACRRFKVPLVGHHRAEADARACGLLLLALEREQAQQALIGLGRS